MMIKELQFYGFFHIGINVKNKLQSLIKHKKDKK